MKHPFLLFVLVLSPVVLRSQIDETTLYNADGAPEAYISFSQDEPKTGEFTIDEPTIYMWSGKPVAYLASRIRGGFNIYGFNGNHLGWFVNGVVRDHEGSPVCGIHRVVSLPKPAPPKPGKQLPPLKSSKQAAPVRPLYKRQWSSTPCESFLFEGAPS